MTETTVKKNINKIIGTVNRFTIEEKLKLINQLTQQIEIDLKTKNASHKKKLGGLWKNVTLLSDDIDEIRNEMWGNFPQMDH